MRVEAEVEEYQLIITTVSRIVGVPPHLSPLHKFLGIEKKASLQFALIRDMGKVSICIHWRGGGMKLGRMRCG